MNSFKKKISRTLLICFAFLFVWAAGAGTAMAASDATNLTVVPNAENNALVLTWINPADFDYADIYRQVDGEEHWNYVGYSTDNTWTDRSVNLTSTYKYKVIVYDTDGYESENPPTAQGALNQGQPIVLSGWWTHYGGINLENQENFLMYAIFIGMHEITDILYQYSADGTTWNSIPAISEGTVYSYMDGHWLREVYADWSAVDPGSYQIRATATDAENNTLTVTTPVVKDLTPPADVTNFTVTADTDTPAFELNWTNPANDFKSVTIEKRSVGDEEPTLYSVNANSVLAEKTAIEAEKEIEPNAAVTTNLSTKMPRTNAADTTTAPDTTKAADAETADWWDSVVEDYNGESYKDTDIEWGVEYEYRIIVQDQAGNESTAPAVVSAELPFEKPVLDYFYPGDGNVTNDEDYYYEAQFMDDQEIQTILFEYSADNGVTWTALNEDNQTPDAWNLYYYHYGNWDISSLDDGVYQIRVTAADAGGRSETVTHSFTIDRTPPDAPSNFEATRTASGISLSWDTAGEGYEYYLRRFNEYYGYYDNSWYFYGTTAYQDTGVQLNRWYRYELFATDPAGNEGDTPAEVRIKYYLGPDLEVEGGPEVYTSSSPYTLKGKATPGTTVTVEGNAATVDENGNFSASITLAEGLNTIEVSASNAEGQTNTEIQKVYLDTTAPTVYDLDPNDNAVIGGKAVQLYAQGRDGNGSGVQKIVFQISRDDAASWIDIGTLEGAQLSRDSYNNSAWGTLEWDSTADIGGMGPLTDGAYKFRVIVHDKAGHVSNGTPVRVWRIDNTAPAAPANVTATPTVDRITINWSANTETDIYLYKVYRSTVSGGEYTWLANILSYGRSYTDTVKSGTKYYYVVTAIDNSGNEGPRSAEVEMESLADATPPTASWYLSEGATVGGSSIQLRVSAYDDSPFGVASTKFEYSLDGGTQWVDLGKGYYSSWYGYYYVDWSTAGLTSGSVMLRFTATDHTDNTKTITRTVNLDVSASKPAATAASGDGTVVVSWDPVPDTDFSYYTVYRSTSQNGWYYEQVSIGNQNTTTFTDTNVNLNQTYYYKVRFNDRYGNYADSDVVSAQPGEDLTAPVVISITPASGSTVGGPQVMFEARATDNKAVSFMQAEYSTDGGVTWNSQGITKSGVGGPYDTNRHYRVTFYWDTAGLQEREYLVRVTAKDAKENAATLDATWTMDKSVSAVEGVAAAADQSKITITWQGVSDTDLPGSAYRVFRSSVSGGPYSILSNWISKSTTSYADTTALPGTTYYYVVETRDNFGNTSRSAEVSGMLQPDTEPPVIASINPATGATLGGPGSKTLHLYFSDNNGNKGTTAKFEYSSDGGESWQAISGYIYGPYWAYWGSNYYYYTYWDTTSLASGSYQVRFTVTDGSGNSNEQTATYTVDRDAPQAPQNLVGAYGTGSITLTWEAPADADVYRYVIYRATSAEGPFQSLNTVYGRNTVTYQDTTVQIGLTYYYHVKAIDSYNQEGPISNVAAAAAQDDVLPPAVTGMTPANGHIFGPGHAVITVNAQDNLALSSIVLQYSTDDGATWTDIATRAATGGSASFNWATDAMNGEVKVRATARDSFGNVSDGTPVYTYTIDRTAPEAPADVTATYGTANISLQWTAPADTDVSHYRIFRSTSVDGPFTYLAQVDGRANVSYTDNAVQIGSTYYYQVKATDTFGQEGAASATATASPNDEIPPVILGMEPAAGTVLGPNARITVRAEDNLNLDRVTLQYSTDGVDWVDIETKDTNSIQTVFTWNPSPLNGDIQLRAIAHDSAGNDSDGTPVRSYRVDTQGPAKVAGLAAEATANGALLTWQDVPDQDFDHFQVEQKDSSGNFVKVATVSTVLGYQVTGLQPETTYGFQVVAYDKLGNRGTPSDLVEVTTVTDTQSPAVTGLSPNPGSFASLIALRGSATDNTGLSTMTFQYSTDLENWTDIAVVPFTNAPKSGTAAFDWDVSALAEGTYSVRGVAADTAGNRSSGTSYVQYRIDHTAPAAPTGLTVQATAGDVTLAWTQGSEADLASYIVYRAEQESGPYTMVKNKLSSLGYRDTNVEAGITYYYKVSAVDQAGNEGAAAGPVSTGLAPDTDAPQILSISPESGTKLPANPNVGVAASDNYRLKELKVEYQKQGAPADQWTTIAHEQNLNVKGLSARYNWSTSGLTDGSYTIRATATDVNGNISTAVTVTYSLNVDAPASPVVTALPGGWKMELSWTSGNEPDLAGFRIYRSTTSGAGYKFVGETTGTTFTDAPLAPGTTYYYVVDALDTYRNAARSAEVAQQPTTEDPYGPTASAGDDQVATVGMEVSFNGTASRDNDRIASYAWDFGDGTTSSEASPTHAYTAVGTYTVTLTVTDPAGNSHTDTLAVDVREPQEVGTLRIRVLDDSSGAGIAGASVVIQYPDGTNQKMITNGIGIAEAAVEPGDYKVFAYKTDYKPAAVDATVRVIESTLSTVRLTAGQLVVGELTVNRMTLDQIIDAGIDVNAPENQFVYKFEVHLAFNNVPLPAPSEFIVNGAGQFVGGAPEPLVIGGGGGGGVDNGTLLAHPVVIPHPNHPEVRPTVAYLVIPGEARWLKEFFNVGLSLENTADPQFVIDGSKATLKLPDGLVLAPTQEPQSLVVDLGSIAGGEKRQVNWIIRGDKKGYYMLEADFNGILQPFGDAVYTVFKTKDPFRVWGEDALKMHVDAQDRSDKGHPYHIRFGIENVSDVPVYNPSLELLEEGKQNYVYAPNQQLLQRIPELKAGETKWFDYWLIPSVEGDLDLSQSYVLRTGGNAEVQTVITSHSVPENAPGAAPVLDETHNPDNTVTLDWGAVGGATGYKIYVVRDDMNMSKALELVHEAGAGETSVTLPEPNGPKNYIINAILANGEILRHAVEWDPGLSGPAITVDPEVIPTGEPTELWITVNSQGFPVAGGKVNVGTLASDVPLDQNGQARISITPQTGGPIEISAYDATGKFLISKTILAEDAVPAVPVGLTATAGNAIVNLQWTANAENDIAGYNIYLDGVLANSSPVQGTSYQAVGLTNGQTYSFTVTAVDAAGQESAASEAVNATPQETSDQQPPVWASGSSLAASEISQTGVKLTWSPAQDETGVTSYRIYQEGQLIDTVTANVYNYDVTGLTAGTAYQFKVEAGDAAGNWSSDGPAATVTTEAEQNPGDQQAPTWPDGAVTVSNVGSTGATVTWTAAVDNAGVANYRIYVDGQLLTTVDANVTSYNISGLTADSTYGVKVEAGDAAGNWSSDGPAATVTTTPMAGAAIVLTASAASVNTNQVVTLTARVTGENGTPTGTVTFMEGSKVLGTATVTNGAANYRTTSLQAGTFNITAVYNGNATYPSSTSEPVALTFVSTQPGPVMNYTLAANYGTTSSGQSYISGFTMTLSAPAGVTDIEKTEYRLNGQGEWLMYSGPFTFDAATAKVEYQSTDLQGNKGPITELDFRKGVVFTLLGMPQ